MRRCIISVWPLSPITDASEPHALAGLFKRAGSLGDAHSLITLAAMISYKHIPRDERIKAKIPPALIRLSVGLECPLDLIEDLRHSLISAD
jgi:cystathionine beta-lyase/cystathionine gamma-synthase